MFSHRWFTAASKRHRSGRLASRRKSQYQTCAPRAAIIEALEDRTLLANLSVTDAFLIDGNHDKTSAPVLGERVGVRVNFDAEDLPFSAEYRIDFVVDGVTLELDDLTFGSGFGNGDWYAYRTGWFASPGTHTVEVIVDAGDDVSETNEADNSATFTFTTGPVTDLPQKFSWSIAGTLFADYTITNYVDIAPDDHLMDFRGNSITYDRHDGLDISTGNFAALDAGIEIYAAADGVVSVTHDGEFDRHEEWLEPAPTANSVTIDHGNGWSTHYLHLRRDSLAVEVGDVVQVGDLLGLMGSSGRSTITHLHFEVQHHGRAVETMLDPDTFWHQPPGYTLDQTTYLYSGVTNHYPAAHRNERPSDVEVFSQAASQSFRSWVVVSGFQQNDTIEYAAFRPNGELYASGKVTASRDYGRSRWSFLRTLPEVPDLGTWRVEFSIDGRILGTDSFEVTANGAPEIRIEDDNEDIILDERSTPIDFGEAARNSTDPTQTFTVVNHGSDTLQLGSISLPLGFRIDAGLPASLPVGGSATFTVALDTTHAGYFAGQIRVANNDKDEADYNFSVEGIVTTATARTLILGIGHRSLLENGRIQANVRRTGSTSQSLVVNMTIDDPGAVHVPATVIIPAGADRAVFFIDGVAHQQAAAIFEMPITATAAGYSPAHNTLDLKAMTTAIPVLTAPLGTSADTTPTFIWSTTTGADHYDLWVNNRTTGEDQVIRQRSLNGTSFTPTSALPGGNYRAWVRAFDLSGQAGEWSTGVDFTIDVVEIGRPKITAPAGSVSDSTPTFAWSTTTGAHRYDLWVNNQSTGAEQVIRQRSLSTTSYTPTSALPAGNYRVWVKAIADSGEEGAWSQAVNFTIDAGNVGRPTLSAPTGTSTDTTPTFAWSTTSGADHYDLWVNNRSTGTDQVLRRTNINGTSYTPTTALPAGTYRAWVRAIGSDGTMGDWSTSRDFTIATTSLGTPQIIGFSSPTQDRTPTLAWTSAAGAIRYDLWVNNHSTGVDQVIRAQNINARSFTPTTALPPGNYRAWIRAIGTNGDTGEWSTRWDFTIEE